MLEKLAFYTRHSFNDLRVNGQRTLFALLCIAAGVAAIVSLQTLGVMIEDTLTGSLQESNRGDIRVSPEVKDDVSEQVADRGVEQGIVTEGSVFSVRTFTPEGIDQITSWFQDNYPGAAVTYRQAINDPSAGLSINIPAKDTNKTFVMPFIVDGQQYPLYGTRETVDGRPLSEVLQGPNDIVLSRNLADGLDAEVGDTVSLSGASEDFMLRGIVPTDEESGFENFQGALFGYYFIDLSAVELFDAIDPGADTIYVRLPDPDAVETVNDAFERAYPYLSTTTTNDLEQLNSEISDIINQLVIVMGLVSLLIGGIGIVNTMLVIVSRRTTEVAVLKTIGLEAEQVTLLFLVEAVIMGFFGSLLGIALGWIAAYGNKGVAEGFLGQSLTFRITLTPPVTGLVVGVVVTTIFGFLPTLAAGQVRPNLVLRPSDTVVPKAGRARSFVALLFVMVSLSLVAQVLARDLMDADVLRGAARGIGAALGLLAGLTMVAGGVFAGWTRGNTVLRVLRWLLLPVGLTVLGALFGGQVPALLILFGTFIIAGQLYIVLWVLIWSIGGGQLGDLWLVKISTLRGLRSTLVEAELPGVLGWLALVALVPVVLVVWLINGLVLVISLPFWVLGRVIQRLALVDLKIAMRSMLAAKGRNASTLLALVVGVFTLSLITMLTTAITQRFEELLENQVGGNVIIFAAGTNDPLAQVNNRLEELDGVRSYSSVGVFSAEFVSLQDTSAGRTLDFDDLQQRVIEDRGDEFVDQLRWTLSGIDARDLRANLPEVEFYEGRQLNASDSGPWAPEEGDYPPIVVAANMATVAAGLEVGDLITFEIGGGEQGPFSAGNAEPETMTFEIVGMTDQTGGQVSVNFGSSNYAPKQAFDARGLTAQSLAAIVDVQEEQIPELRRTMNEIPGIFVLETKTLNDLITRIIDQFTSFPILVAGLALVVGGIVIANSVALSTLERRREIAIMKAVGLQRERVLAMLLMEYGLMGFIGGLIGVGIGGIGLLLMLTQAFGGALGESIPIWTALQLMLLCVGIALAAAVVSAWGASGEKPLNVLRYE